jgi:hypothetical protein
MVGAYDFAFVLMAVGTGYTDIASIRKKKALVLAHTLKLHYRLHEQK